MTKPTKFRAKIMLPWLALAVGVIAVVVIRLLASGNPSLSQGLPNDRDAHIAAAILRMTASAQEPAPQLPVGQSVQAIERSIAPLPASQAILTRQGLRISEAPFERVLGTRRNTFVGVDGTSDGLEATALPPLYETMLPGENEYAPLASGDVNGDGWPDLAVGTAYGVYLYINLGGRFALERIQFPQMRNWIISEVALVDLDGDGRPDLTFCAWQHGCYILWNRGSEFSVADSTKFGPTDTTVTALAFADFGHDGRVDIATGTSTALEWNFYPQQSSIDEWINQGGHRFVPHQLPGPHGETLSLLASDLSGNGWPDLYAANDFDEPDRLFGNQHGKLVPYDRADSPLPKTTMSDMSADSADIANHGKLDLYEDNISYGAISPQALARKELDPGTACQDSYADDSSELRNCATLANFQTAVLRSRDITNVSECRHLTIPVQQRDCVGAGYLWNELFTKLPTHAKRSVVLAECNRLPADMSVMRDLCAEVRHSPIDFGQQFKVLTSQMRQVTNTNLLFAPSGHRYKDITRAAGVAFGGWSWNAQFADLNNDGWQDLFVTQGTRLRFDNASNLLYLNHGGKRFTDAAQRLGLTDHVPTGGSLFIDINMDGRLDLMTYPFALTPKIWGNDLRIAPGLQITLRDDRSQNTAAIGAEVTISSPDGQTQMREIKASGGFESQNEPIADFGLGTWKSVASITVRWPDGESQTVGGLSLKSGRYTIERLK